MHRLIGTDPRPRQAASSGGLVRRLGGPTGSPWLSDYFEPPPALNPDLVHIDASLTVHRTESMEARA